MLYYGLVLIAVAMFGVMFYGNGLFQQQTGDSAYASFYYTFATSIIGAAAMFVTGGLTFNFTPFTLLMACLAALNSMLFSFCAIRALGMINLSLFSVFSMIGGMFLPFAAGILFYSEGITVAKVICFILITVAMLFTIDRSGKKGGWIYYTGVFISNGMSGVFSMIFANAELLKGSEADYSLLSSLLKILLSGLAMAYVVLKKQPHPSIKPVGKTALALFLGGFFCIGANYLLLISLNYVPGSLQYPMVTGGVMIVSTVIGFFTTSKPRKKDVLSVAVAFLGMLALLLPF